MTWSDFYLICFTVGFLLSAISFVAGGMRWHLHMPHFPQGGGQVGGGHATLGHGNTASGTVSHGSHQAPVWPVNFVTLAAFLAWFGGTGFLVTRFSSLWFALGLGIALVAGVLGAAIVFLFLTRVLISREENMDAADYEMVGVLGRISMPIRDNGTGEIIYSQAGTRRTCGARSENGSALEKGTEIMVARYERGIAYVKRWEDVSGE
jgi:membrane protein implicated in regulation of membrane protease activity